MKKESTLKTSMENYDEYPEVTQADIDRSILRVNMIPVERKQRISIMLDSRVISFFKGKAGSRGYQTLINEALKKEIEHDDFENRLRKIIREELSKDHGHVA